MIDCIRGKVIEIGEDFCVLFCQDIGYHILASRYSLEGLEKEDTVLLYTQLVVREDSLSLYGFKDKNERKLFELFNTVTSIGPKAALSLLSTAPVDRLKQAILLEDVASLKEAPGIGKKSAERIILELKDKVQAISGPVDLSQPPLAATKSSERATALQALVGLGYNEYEAKGALQGLGEEEDLETLIRQALKALSKNI
ncbi:MAG: Holliday junction branch migration protein RuvA [Tissierellia bacterium]|nr:Holliday junction branch migration protein RuvA [Tissierellia bacterium]